MSLDRERRIKTQIAEIFASKNPQWITTISMIVEVMYQQFIRECEESEKADRMLEKMALITGETTALGRKPDMSRAT
jgi:hypothetical protein